MSGPPPEAPMDEFELFKLVEPEAKKHNLPVGLLLRQIKQESGGKVRAVSPKGAVGLMQLMPATGASYGVTDATDPAQNVRAGVQHMASLWKKHKGDQRKVLAEYNGGAAAVDALARGKPWKETAGYLSGILPSDQAPQQAPMPGQEPAAPVDEFEAFRQTLAPAPVVHQGAAGAERLTPGYSPMVDFARGLPAAAGSMISMASRAGGIPGAVVGSVLGGVGAAGGETAVIGLENAAYQSGLSGVPPPSPDAALNRIGMAGAVGAGGELLSRPVSAVAGKLMAPFASSMDATGQEVQRMFPDALPNQVVSSPYLDAATAVAEAGITSGGKVTARKQLLANQAQQEAFEIVHKYGGPVSEEAAGKVFQEALEGNTSTFKSHASKLYADVDNLSEGVKVDLSGLKAFATEQLEKRAGVPGEVSGNRGLKMLNQVAKAGETEVEDSQLKELAQGLGVTPEELAKPAYAKIREQLGISDAPMAKEMTFQQAATFRSDLTSFIRQATREKDDVARGTAQQLLKRLDEAMDGAGAAASPELATAYKSANAFYREGKTKYESELMRGLADQYPEEVVRSLIGGKRTTPIREARAAIGPEAWKKVQARVADDTLTKATNDAGEIVGSDLLGELRKLSPATLKEIYPGDEARALWTLGRVLERSQKSVPATAKVGVYLAQSGVILGVLRGAVSPQALGILLTPKLLANILTSPRGAKWLTTGLEAPKGSKLAAQAARKIAEQGGLSWAGGRDAAAPPPAAAAPPETARYPFRGAPPPAP